MTKQDTQATKKQKTTEDKPEKKSKASGKAEGEGQWVRTVAISAGQSHESW